MYQQELALSGSRPTRQRQPYLPVPERRGNSVYIKRVSAGLSRDDLARKSGISSRTIEAVECYRIIPSVYVALALSRALGCPVDRLFRFQR